LLPNPRSMDLVHLGALFSSSLLTSSDSLTS
jgi:hypothetical protein